MNKLSRLVISLSTMLALGTSYAGIFSGMVTFGDSLSDMGNYNDPVRNVYAPWTDFHGNLWDADLANRLGVDFTPSKDGGTDYAYYGAWTYANSNQDVYSKDYLSQINQFLATGNVNPNALYTTWIGSNDLLGQIDPNNIGNLPGDLINAAHTGIINIITGVNELHNAGAKYQMVMNIPDLGKVPLVYQLVEKNMITPGEATLLSLALTNFGAGTFNNGLRQSLNALPYDVIQVDIFSFMDAVIANPAKFGLQYDPNNPKTICLDPSFLNNGVCSFYDPSVDTATALFFDSVHPSAAADKVLADFVYSYIIGPIYASYLSYVPLSVAQAVNHDIATQLAPFDKGINQAEKTWRVFASGNYADSHPGNFGNSAITGSSTHNGNLTIGGKYYYNPAISFGASFSPSHNEFNTTHYKFTLDEYMFSVFGEYKPDTKTYMNAILNYGIPSYKNIQRSITLGPATDTTNPATTGGSHFAGTLNLGYNFLDTEKFSTGPIANLTYQYVKANGYEESGATNGVNLNYFKQVEKNLTSGIGWQLTELKKFENFILLGTGSIQENTQHLGQSRDMRFGTASLDGSHGAIPIIFPQGSYTTLSATITSIFKNQMALTFGATTTVGNTDFNQQMYNLTLSRPF